MKVLRFLLLFCCSVCIAQQVSIKKDTVRTTKDTLVLSIKNNMLSPMVFKSAAKKGIAKDFVFPEVVILQPSEKKENYLKIPRKKIDTTKSLKLSLYMDFYVGYNDPENVQHNDAYRYLLPYKKRRKLIQGNFGRFSHDHIRSFHAYDFGTKIGDTIYAAREGKVVMMKDDSKKHGRTRKFANFANYIIILHDDGTTAAYYHLDFKGVLVEKGAMVKRGQAIGISGMTGFTTTPHLHFVVHKATTEKGNISIPIQFEGFVGKKFRKGKKYRRKN